MQTNNFILYLAVVIGLTGCSFFTPHQGFEDVSKQTEGRISSKVLWRTGSNEDAEINDLITKLIINDLEIDDVVQISLINNYDLQAKYQELGLAQSDLIQGGRLSNPSILIQRRFPGKALEIDVAQNFLSLILLPMRKSMVEAAFEAAKFDITQAVLDQVFATREAFYKLQAEEELLEVQRSMFLAGQAAATAAEGLRNAGNITLLEEQSEKQKAGETKIKLLETEMEVVDLREHLNVLMGLAGEQTKWNVKKKISILPPADSVGEELQEVAVGNRPDFLALNQETIAQGRSLGITNIESYIPELTISSHYEREPEGNSTTGPSIEFPIPIFNFGDAKRGAAQAMFDQVKSRYKALEVKIRSEVRSTQGRMRISRAKADYIKNLVIPLQKKRMEQSQLQYNGMFLGVFKLLDTKLEQLNAQGEYVKARRDYWLSRTALEKALGKELPISENTSTKEMEEKEPPSNSSNPFQHHHH